MPRWTEARTGGFRACEARLGPYLLAAYGLRRRYCWEVTAGRRGGRILTGGEAPTLAAAQDAAEAAALAQLRTIPQGAAWFLPPVPETWQ